MMRALYPKTAVIGKVSLGNLNKAKKLAKK